MNKADLFVALAKETDLPLRKTQEIVNLVFETMSRALLKGTRIEVRGFGSFEVREYGSYAGRNPKTGVKMTVAKKRLPFFKVGKELRQRVNSRR